MIDWYVWLAPIAVLPLVLLLVFVGCGLLIDLDPAGPPARVPAPPALEPSDITAPPPTAPAPTDTPSGPIPAPPAAGLCILYGRVLLLELRVPTVDLMAIGRGIRDVTFLEHPSFDRYDVTTSPRRFGTEDVYTHMIAPVDPGTYAYSCEVTCVSLATGAEETRGSTAPPHTEQIYDWDCEVVIPFEVRVDTSSGSWEILTRLARRT